MIRHGLKLAKIASTLVVLKTSLSNPLLLRQFEIAFNTLLQNQPQTYPHLHALNGKTINVKFSGINIEWNLVIIHEQILINPGLQPNETATIEIDTLTLPGHLLGLTTQQAISFEGDLTAVLQLQGLSQKFEFDLYPVLTDLAGGQIATLLFDIKNMVLEQAHRLKPQL